MEHAQTTVEESQQMTTIHKAYQRAIIMPTHHVEQLWRDYANFVFCLLDFLLSNGMLLQLY